MDTESSCTTVLISDDPSKTDSFGSHERVAKAIAQLIDKESGGKSIALTGTWGSGKSTVVELMKNYLDDDTEVFLFDAWAHEGDPLRRTFLEQLVDFLIPKGWINKKCVKIKNELSGKTKNQKTESTPVLTDAGKVFGVTALLVPFGLAILSWAPNMVEQLPYMWALSISGAVLTLSPLLSLAYLPLYRLYSTSKKAPDKCQNKKDEGLLVLINQYRTKVESETIETIDPTSLEFQRHFKKTLESALGDKNRKLLIVVDNLDRIDAKDALEVWATMRTFFDFDSNDDAEWISRLWLLVPFDKDALIRLWHFDEKQNYDSEQDDNEQSPSEKLVQSFIDKSFQITFNVASPVHTTWKDFLLTQLNEAFPEHNHDDFYIIYRLYRLRRTSTNKFPTPRDLKLFVNNVGALHRQWCDKIPLPIQALYVILQREGNPNFEDKLIEDIIVSDKELHLIDSKYKQYLAALHFNVLVKDSLQILMAPRIETALRDGDIDDMNKMCKLKGFTQVCEMVLEENRPDLSKGDGQDICIAADTLSTLEQIDDESWRSIWDLLCSSIEKIPFLGEIDERIGCGLVQLLRHQTDDYFAKSIIIQIGNSGSRLDDYRVDDKLTIGSDSLDDWLKGIFTVLVELRSTGHHDIINDHFYIKCSAPTYIKIISRLNESAEWNNIDIHSYFKTNAEINDVVYTLSEKVQGNKFSDYRKCVATMLLTNHEWDWKGLITSLEQQLNGSNHIDPTEVCANLHTLLDLKKFGVPQTDMWNTLAVQGHLFHQLHVTSNNAKATALCLIPILQAIPDGSLRQHTGHSQEGFNRFNAIMQNPDSYPQIVTNFAQYVVELSTLEPYIALPVKTPNTSNFIYAVMEAIAKEEPLAKMLTEYDFNVNISHIYSIALNKINQNNAQKFTEFLIDGFKIINKDTWFSEMHHDGSTLQLLVDVVDTGHQPELTTNFQDALLEHAKHLIEGNAELHPSKDNWYKVYSALASHTKITFLKKLLDMVIRYEDDSTDKILDIYGELLVDCNILNNDADDLVLVGFKNFIEKMSDVELTWMNNVISNCPTILTACELQSKMDFEDRMTLALNDDELSEEIQGLLGAIAEQLGIDIPQKYDDES